MNSKRPVNLDLATLKFPTMAITSILHRISGVIMFLLLPVMMYFLTLSLRSSDSFDYLQGMLLSPYCKLLLWAFSVAMVYHILAGIRHVFMDFGIGEKLVSAQRSAMIVIIITVILTIFLGVWIW